MGRPGRRATKAKRMYRILKKSDRDTISSDMVKKRNCMLITVYKQSNNVSACFLAGWYQAQVLDCFSNSTRLCAFVSSERDCWIVSPLSQHTSATAIEIQLNLSIAHAIYA
jgi:hypothetical protein